MKVFVAVISRNQPYWLHIQSVNVMSAYSAQAGISVVMFPYIGDSLVSRARQECLAKFKESDSDYQRENILLHGGMVVKPPEVILLHGVVVMHNPIMKRLWGNLIPITLLPAQQVGMPTTVYFK